MEMKVEVMQRPCLSSYSSPQHPLDLFFYSTPSSPHFEESSSSYHHHHHHLLDDVSLLSHHQTKEASSSVPFNWELMPGIPRSTAAPEPEAADNSDFDFSGQLDRMVRPSLSSADELFDGGKIRPLKPPPRLLHNPPPAASSPSSPKMMSKFRDALSLSPNQRTKSSIDDDPFEAALNRELVGGRGRGRDPNVGNARKGISRSLSPLRVSEFALLSQQQQEEEERNSEFRSSSSKKWRLKDLFLFRSASEGRPKKYSFLSRRNSMDKIDREGDSKNSSFRSTTGGVGSVSKRRGGHANKISAHEMHYTANRSVSDELKKKTSLPYRHGLLGWMLKFKSNP